MLREDLIWMSDSQGKLIFDDVIDHFENNYTNLIEGFEPEMGEDEPFAVSESTDEQINLV